MAFLALPVIPSLKITDKGLVDVSTFQFISGSVNDDDGNESGNIDVLQFNYTVVDSFVSRACGFVANFNDLDTVREVTANDWIQGINIVESDITISNRIHVQIFH